MTDWHKGLLLAFDSESSGVDVENDRIVTACASLINGTTGEANTKTWLANLQYDLTLLDRETRRHGLEPLEERFAQALPFVIDVRPLDKYVDRYRKGGRKLTDLCATYDVRIDGAHDASHDAIAAARVAYRIAQRHPSLAALPLAELHALQVKAHASQQRSFRAYRAKKGEPVDAREEWPIIPFSSADEPVEAAR